MRKTTAAMAGAAVFFSTAAAWGQEFGRQGDFAIAAERVFGFFYENVDYELNDPARTSWDETDTTIGFAWGDPHWPYTIPRFGVDYFVIDSLSVGGSLAFFTHNHDNDNGPGGDNDSSGFLLSPRVGYAIPFGGIAGFWPRGGLTFATHGGDYNGSDMSELALTLEGMFWIAPAEGLAFIVGPTLDIGITGDQDLGPVDADYNRLAVGISVGLMGWL